MSSSPSQPAIDLRQVSKMYRGGVHALRGVDMRVNQGEVFGLLGPNGAGKSTLVKIMMTVVRATHVQGSILGHRVGHKPTLAKVGYLPENHRLPKYLTGRQALEFFAALSNVNRVTRRRRIDELLETVGMARWAGSKLATYSKGMLQRIGLAQAMVHDPQLLVLDEPTDGVDPVGRRDILELIKRIRGQGRTVFVNSHALSELESICDRVAILINGEVARQGTIDDLTRAKQYYEVEVAQDANAADPKRLRDALPARWEGSASAGDEASGTLHAGPAVILNGSLLRVASIDPAAVQPVIDALRLAAFTIRRVQLKKPSLEDLFIDTVAEARP